MRLNKLFFNVTLSFQVKYCRSKENGWIRFQYEIRVSLLALTNLKVDLEGSECDLKISKSISGQAKRISNERQMIARLDPAELQDRYLRLYDDHTHLKQHARKQEDKIKK